MNRFANTVVLVGMIAGSFAAAPLNAQGRGRNLDGVPPGHRPPPGMCRIWIDGVPPGQQPAPTDCANAVRNRPSNGRIIFGDDGGRGGKGRWKSNSYDTVRRSDADDRNVGRDRGNDTCLDRDRDGRCDDVVRAGGYPSTLPDMIAGVLLGRGQRSRDVSQWLGGSAVTARSEGLVRNGRPQRVVWYDQAGRVMQVWTDTNLDGRADRVEVFRDGRLVQIVR